jgi:hypothetical protein
MKVSIVSEGNNDKNRTILIEDAMLMYARLDPENPQQYQGKGRFTWSVAIQTESKAEKKELEEYGFKPKAVIPDEDDAPPYFKMTVSKYAFRKDEETPNEPIEVVDDNVEPMVAKNVGNGTIADVLIYQYVGNEGDWMNSLSGIQIDVSAGNFKEYVPKERYKFKKKHADAEEEKTSKAGFKPKKPAPTAAAEEEDSEY